MPNFHHYSARQFNTPDKMCLPLLVDFGYIDPAPAKSGVRISTLNNEYKATYDAPSVFFYVTASQHLPFKAVFAYTYSMVMLAGQPSGWLVSLYASSANPVSVTAPIEISTSRGDSLTKYKEIATMATIPTPTHFKFEFLSVKRADLSATPSRIEAIAPDEHGARSALSRDFVLLFACRLPVQEVHHV
ncbi:host cell division inhibitor Icd-like protein [Xenorhabdus sp. Sc-CR9]|uniref:host cell division inhibitor Icd-like protein n=1 Tax=Xenorhabdus sp. Sc-CR9 TaxID=2584468 RepID=UPI001F3DA93C|nr:host cell division inhibitor Icd-like protein [Xenorhabdus sp. Sc-CR9]